MRKRPKLRRSAGQERRLAARRDRIAFDRLSRCEAEEGRIVCDRCGLEQAMRHAPWMERRVLLAPCEGPLGLPCGSETAISVEAYQELAA